MANHNESHDEFLVNFLQLVMGSSEVNIRRIADEAVMVLKGLGLQSGARATLVHDRILQSLTHLSEVDSFMRMGK